MANQTPPTQFIGKTWIFLAQVVVFGGLAGFSLLFGPLLLFGIMERADGKPGTEAGVALCVMSVPLLVLFALGLFNILARRRPILHICREGLEINTIGSSSLDDVPLILPVWFRVAWLVVSLQGFRRQLLRAPWQCFQHAQIGGPPMARTLTIVGSLIRPVSAPTIDPAPIGHQVSFGEVAFAAPLDRVRYAIDTYFKDIEARDHLPSWDDEPASTRS